MDYPPRNHTGETQMIATPCRLQPKVPGLTMLRVKVGSFTYVTAIHTQSQKTVWCGHNWPCEVPLREMAKRVERSLGSFDWAVPANEIAQRNGGIDAIRFAVSTLSQRRAEA